MARSNPSPVVAVLRREQSNSLDLYLRYKGYHWNVAGALFRELHLLFDEHAERVLASVDELAERQRILGAGAAYSIDDLRRSSTLPEEHALPATPRAMIDRLLVGHRVILDGLHEGFRAAETHSDPGSGELFARLIAQHEKMEWFLRESVAELPAASEQSEARATVLAEKSALSHPATWAHPIGGIPERPIT